jgi:hypothetical protein
VLYKLQALFNIIRDEWEITCNEGARTVEKQLGLIQDWGGSDEKLQELQ